MIDNITGIILAGGKCTRIGTSKAFLKIGEKTIIEEIVAKFKDIFREVIVVANELERFDSLLYRNFNKSAPDTTGGLLRGVQASPLKGDSDPPPLLSKSGGRERQRDEVPMDKIAQMRSPKGKRVPILDVSVIADIVPGKGPLGGIYTGLVKSNNFYNFIVACDMPFLRENLVRYMLEESNGCDVVIPEYNGRLEPLCAVYSKNCIKPIQTELSRNNLKITDFFQYVNPALSATKRHFEVRKGGVKIKIITEREIAKFDPEGLCFVNINTPEDYRRLKDGRIKN